MSACVCLYLRAQACDERLRSLRVQYIPSLCLFPASTSVSQQIESLAFLSLFVSFADSSPFLPPLVVDEGAREESLFH